MSSHLSRRAALIVAGQGMAALLLAACGRSVEPSASGPSSAAAVSDAARIPLRPSATRPPVTVPGLEPTSYGPAPTAAPGSSATRTRIPLTPVTHSSTPSSLPTPSTAGHPPLPPSTSVSRPTTTASGPGTTAVTTVTRNTPTSPPAATTTTTTTTATTTTSATTTSRPVSGPGLAGKVVAIDPGHNGANGQHPEIINKLIDGGYGQRNVCNTTGTQTDAGYTEHEFTWHVASYLRPMLEAKGIKVVMTRFNDTGVGPCTDKRAGIENSAEADAVVSIHGDGAPPEVRGFYVLTATRPPAGAAMAAASLRLAACIAAAAIDQGFPASNTLGSGGLWKRDDLTGLNRSMRPKILIECGNMRNAAEAAIMSSTAGQKRYAQALAEGVFAFLLGR